MRRREPARWRPGGQPVAPVVTRLVELAVGLLVVLAVTSCGSGGSASSTTVRLSGAAAEGESVVRDLGCTTCHTVDGSDGVGPTFQGLAGSTVALEGARSVTADDAYLRRSITDPGAQVVEGFRPLMPERTLSDAQVDSIVAYLRAIGSNSG